MDKKKATAILSASIIAIAAISIAIALNNDDDAPDGKTGWYAWDPVVVEGNSKYSNITPMFMNIAESIYKDVFGPVPSHDGIGLDDIPDEYRFPYDPYWRQSGDSMEIKTFDNTSTGLHAANVFKELKFKPVHIIPYNSAYIDTMYMILCDKYGEPDHAGKSPQAEKELWELIPAIPQGVENLTDRFGLEVPGHVKIFGKDRESLIKQCESETEDTVVLMSESKIRSTTKDSWWENNRVLEDRCPNIQFFYLLANSPSMVLSTIEMLGKLIDSDSTDAIMTSVLAEIYVMQKTIDERCEAQDSYPTFYVESSSKKSVGSNSLMGGIYAKVLKLRNIYDGDLMGGKISDEEVVEAMPDVIGFYVNDPRTMDERMRVPA